MARKNDGMLFLLAAAGGLFWFLSRGRGRGSKEQYLTEWFAGSPGVLPVEVSNFAITLGRMSDPEVGTVYEYIHDYYSKGKSMQEGSDLFKRVMLVSNKYNIFT